MGFCGFSSYDSEVFPHWFIKMHPASGSGTVFHWRDYEVFKNNPIIVANSTVDRGGRLCLRVVSSYAGIHQGAFVHEGDDFYTFYTFCHIALHKGLILLSFMVPRRWPVL